MSKCILQIEHMFKPEDVVVAFRKKVASLSERSVMSMEQWRERSRLQVLIRRMKRNLHFVEIDLEKNRLLLALLEEKMKMIQQSFRGAVVDLQTPALLSETATDVKDLKKIILYYESGKVELESDLQEAHRQLALCGVESFAPLLPPRRR